MKTWIGVGQAADELGLSTQAVRNLIRSDKLDGHKDPGGRWRIDAASVSDRVAKYGRRKRAESDVRGIERTLDELARSIDFLLESERSSARLLDAVERERDRHRADAATARDAALRLVASAQDTDSAVSELLGVLQKQRDALVQLLAPGSPQDLMP
jgi:excisionase family DNA binding protein